MNTNRGGKDYRRLIWIINDQFRQFKFFKVKKRIEHCGPLGNYLKIKCASIVYFMVKFICSQGFKLVF